MVVAALTLFVATWMLALLDGTLSPTATGLQDNPWATPAFVPQQLLAQPRDRDVDLGWRPTTQPVNGYNVYRATERGGPYQLLNAAPSRVHFYRDAGLPDGTYYYVVQAVTTTNREAPIRSNEVRVVIPTG